MGSDGVIAASPARAREVALERRDDPAMADAVIELVNLGTNTRNIADLTHQDPIEIRSFRRLAVPQRSH